VIGPTFRVAVAGAVPRSAKPIAAAAAERIFDGI
jgi:hypothetical protein